MRLRMVLTALLFLAAALAGCTDTDEGAGPDPTGTPTDTPRGAEDPRVETRAGTFVPWTLSDFWVYDMEVRGLGRFDETKLVHYRESGPEYVVGAPTYDEALYHAVFSVNPILGRVHAHLLSPHEDGEHAHMFPFHLDPVIEDGERWSTVFYQRQVQMTASFDAEIPTPDGSHAGYRIEGVDGSGDFRIAYSYVPTVKWFTYLTVTDPAGTVIDLRLTDHGTGYSGGAHFIRGKDLFAEPVSADGIFMTTRTFEVTRDLVQDKRVESFAISADIDIDGENDPFARLILKDPDGNEVWSKRYRDQVSGEDEIVEVWPTGAPQKNKPVAERAQWPAGTYTLEFRFTGEATADVRIVGTQDDSGRV